MAFMIVGKDRPVYELMMAGGREDLARQAQFILHSALDMVELNVYSNPAMLVDCTMEMSLLLELLQDTCPTGAGPYLASS